MSWLGSDAFPRWGRGVRHRVALAIGRVPYRIYRVRGRSMEPTLREGSLVVVDCRNCAPSLGSMVLLRDPERAGARLIKRLASRGRNTIAVTSDNPLEGRDSRHFGSIPEHQVLGTVVPPRRPTPRC